MKTLLQLVAGLLSVTATLPAQLVCRASATAPTVRAEGMAELVGDIVLECRGGSPARTGDLLPQYQILVSSNSTLTSRLLTGGTRSDLSWTDTLLVVDDPATANQIACDPAAGTTGCPRAAGEAGPNVFQGRQLQDNLLVFSNIPIDAPGADGVRTIRIVNVRANVARLIAQEKSSELRASVQMLSGGRPVVVENSDVRVAQSAPALKFDVRTAFDGEVSSGDPVFTVTPGMVPVAAPSLGPMLNVKFSELLPTAFRRRNIATTAADPTFVAAQARPGLDYSTESGFFNNALVTKSNVQRAGLADSGTRLRVSLKDVPKNVTLWASVRDVAAGTSGYSPTSPKAILVDAGPNGAGVMTVVRATAPGFFQVPVSEGRATIVWEVVSSSPESLDTISFSLALTSEGPAPWLGTAWIAGTFGPFYEDSSAGEAAPRFTSKLAEVRAFTVADAVRTQTISVVSGASFSGVLAPDSVASIFGSGFSAAAESARNGLSTAIGETTVDIIDFAGVKRRALLFSVAPTQINFLVDPATQPGPAVVNVTRGNRLVATGAAQIERVAPALFSADRQGSGVALGELLRIADAGGDPVPLATYDEKANQWLPTPVEIGNEGDLVYLILYGTGLRYRSDMQSVKVTIGETPTPALSIGASSIMPGLDQLTVGPLPGALRGRGFIEILVEVDRKASNRVLIRVP